MPDIDDYDDDATGESGFRDAAFDDPDSDEELDDLDDFGDEDEDEDSDEDDE
ncbi:MAG TPA: hypothetical protein VFN48_06160 [Solirubrobacteraceae bacterium]|nr:hypothetical protein [Solirubrobacteraceae bacterium]